VADTYTRAEAAEKAGLSEEEFGRLVELGIVRAEAGDRYTSGNVRKAVIVQGLEAGGLPLEGIGQAIRDGVFSLDFVEEPAYERFTALSSETFEDVSRRTGIPVELLMVIREAGGGAQPLPTDRMRDGELEVVPYLEIQVREGFAAAPTERLMRTQGDSLARMAAAEADWWRSQVMMPRVEKGARLDDVAAARLADEVRLVSEQAMLAIWHAQQVHAWTSNIVVGIEYGLELAGIQRRKTDVQPAMCFFDITGYTRLTQEEGDTAAANLAEQLRRLVQRTSIQHGGRAVKWLGDGVMFHFPDPGPGVMAALDMCDGVREAGLPPAHVGLHAGPVVFQEGDYYGQTVNIASRIAEYARPGEVLVSQAVAEASEAVAARFTDIGPVELKGVGGTVHLLAAHRS
jgi:adenylate cyclase